MSGRRATVPRRPDAARRDPVPDLAVPPADISGDDLKSCCARFYQQDLVALLLGDSFHPGGRALTRRLAASLGVAEGDHVLDVASGTGSTALLLAAEHGARVDGVDLGPDSVRRAAAAAAEQGLSERVDFRVGDAERLPFGDAVFDALVCECAFCTFPDKGRAARELARVLRYGGRVGITDVVVDPDALHPELRTLAGWVACIADARPVETYRRFLWDVGLVVTRIERHDDALREMVETIGARLQALKLAGLPLLEGVEGGEIETRVSQAVDAVEDGTAGYALMIAEKR